MSSPKYQLFENVHKHLKLPSEDGETYLTREKYFYYHYCCDGVNDVGYGCGYRTIQSICSMLKNKLKCDILVPSLLQIQEILVEIGDKEKNFIGSREWIGSIEGSYIFDQIYNVQSIIVHVSHNENISSKKDKIVDYFKQQGGLIFLGGDTDAAAKLIAGIHISKNGSLYLLIIDPHYSKIPNNVDDLIKLSYIKWYTEKDFVNNSFYNLCMPKLL
ncbi:hypothetical protein PVAND_010066 [Polypedilum vanderplanki]|uniref:UFSP1/2/DUB catalytic domain-containing protein n=1 Tax=Polypedilum vanderplanki TaxID=319348 RepID=A0A9J6CFI5_POLVA|nr:hypothetical protein PVAND_010066 [Polypedilum vanderplanki]